MTETSLTPAKGQAEKQQILAALYTSQELLNRIQSFLIEQPDEIFHGWIMYPEPMLIRMLQLHFCADVATDPRPLARALGGEWFERGTDWNCKTAFFDPSVEILLLGAQPGVVRGKQVKL